MAKVLGPFTMVFQRPSPGLVFVTFSTNTIWSDNGAFETSCATSAAMYLSVASMRHWRLQATGAAAEVSAVGAGGLLQAPSSTMVAAPAAANNDPDLLVNMDFPSLTYGCADREADSMPVRDLYNLLQ